LYKKFCCWSKLQYSRWKQWIGVGITRAASQWSRKCCPIKGLPAEVRWAKFFLLGLFDEEVEKYKCFYIEKQKYILI
jgi:hypothetical protein